MRRVYFDNNATTPVLPEVFEAMRPYFGTNFGNASSIHHHGQETRAAVEDARQTVADLLGCGASEIVFTSGGTESDNLAVAGWVAAGNHIIEGLTTVTFAEAGGKTTMTLHTRGVAVVDYAVAYLQGMEVGWTGSIDKLEILLARRA